MDRTGATPTPTPIALLDLHDTTHSARDRDLCGWRVRSALPLPELPLWHGDDRAPDIEITIGCVSDSHPDHLTHVGPFVSLDSDGTCRFEVPAIARFLVANGRSIVVEPRVSPSDPAVRLLLLGNVLGLLCQQRAVLPLHASCVRIGDEAAVFVGSSGMGKSVIAAVLAREGFAVLADDVCAIDWRSTHAPLVLPSVARLAVWSSTLAALGLAPREHARLRTDIEKYALAVPLQREPLRIGAIYHLVARTPPSIHAFVPDARSMLRFQTQLHSPALARRTIGERALFQATACLATVPHFLLWSGTGVGDAMTAANEVRALHPGQP
jgi:hypothetical protein